jgi:glucose-1-phosphate thymidylyltransferase
MLLPLGETPVIDRIPRALENDERIDTIYLSTNEIFTDVFAEHVEEMGYETVQLSVE